MQQSFSNYSFHKQNVVLSVTKLLADRHQSMVRANSRHNDFVFVDAHGGLGLWRNGKGQSCLGSPVIIYRQLERDNIDYRGFVFEKNENRHKKLVDHLRFSQSPVECYNMDNSNAPSVIADVFEGDACHARVRNLVEVSDNPFSDTEVQVNTAEIGGLIYYDNDGHGHASEIEALTRNNRLDILIHAMVPKREMYRVSNQRRLVSEEDVETILFGRDKCLPQHIDKFHRPYWYIGYAGAGKYNTNQFMFMFGTHTPLEHSDMYSTAFANCADADGGESYIKLSDELAPMYSHEGVYRQYRAHYSSDDMAYFDSSILDWNGHVLSNEYQLKNTIPFQVKTGMVYNEENSVLHVGEGSIRREQTADVEFMF